MRLPHRRLTSAHQPAQTRLRNLACPDSSNNAETDMMHQVTSCNHSELLQQPLRGTCGVLVGTTMYAGMPANCAASAMDSAWLPEECVTTPRLFCSSLNEAIALNAPRNLKAPLCANRSGSPALLCLAGSARWRWDLSLRHRKERATGSAVKASAPFLELLALKDNAEACHPVNRRARHDLHQASQSTSIRTAPLRPACYA